METATNCLNCGKPLKSKHRFCPKCGQSAKTRRFSLREVGREMQKRVLHAEAGILQLTRALALRPGVVAREYVEGKRKKYYSPLKYLTLSAAVSVFINEYFSLLDNMHANSNPGTEIATRFFNLIILLSVPISAFFSWLLFKKKSFNFAENLVLHAYLGGFRTVFFILLFTPLVVWFPEYYYRVLSVYFSIWFVYMAWALMQFFGGPIWLTVLKTLLILLFNQVVITGAIFAGIIIRLRL